ncbi:hypothetical protein L198_07603 [Cryptococcus wingfieldii CBS 7118]|uniref:Cytoplasmic protein n=1 Tax=Cryptococcus wingfieldii CBS 7118 TaxID=1295528 RepID=A0A1E3I9F3_9TREE|nr:hypothetical protein L198_07603 [Cryptococcus wingfieldii CBS 7118]ODN85279.1 hypothetical protein L198_07603 [Cryptococcus wingfieldii CBS 7118]
MPLEVKTILVTGANRGIGLEIAKSYLDKGWKVVAAVRDVGKMPKLEGDLLVLKIDAAYLTDAQEAAQELRTRHNIHDLTILLANAGVGLMGPTLAQTPVASFEESIQINTRGPLLLYQAFRDILGDGEGKTFAVVSSKGGSILTPKRIGFGVYGCSKAAVNFLVRAIHFEETKLKAFAIHPGWVETEMGIMASTKANMNGTTPQRLEYTVPGIIRLLETTTKEEHSGWMWE